MWSALIPDSYNPNKIILKTGKPRVQITTSILEMSFAPSQYWSQKKLTVPNGQLTKFSIDSDILQSQRDYWIYLPTSYDKNVCHPLLIVFDGQFYYESGIPLPTIIDKLIDEKKIPPIIVVFIDSIGFYERMIDLKCSQLFLHFITLELLPEINSKYSISNNRLDKALMGASLGGLFSLYASLKHPDLFGKVLSQSDGDNSISQLIQGDQAYPLKIYLDIGSLENASTIQKTRDLLLSVGHEVIYEVIPGSHDLICWETAIPNALILLFGANN
jgi:enterochelin esterase family protein